MEQLEVVNGISKALAENTQGDNTMNIYTKLAKARLTLNGANLKKSGENSFAKYKYYQLKDFIPTINKINDTLGLVAVFNLTNEKATLTIINLEKPEERITLEAPYATADVAKGNAVQNLGGSITYLKRYLYQNAYEITEDDAIEGYAKANTNIGEDDSMYRQYLLDSLHDMNISDEQIISYKKKSNINEVSNADLKRILDIKHRNNAKK